jgi:hypothetical protein
MTDRTAETIGAHGARLDRHDNDLDEIKRDLREIRDAMRELQHVASFGRGVLWAALKVGALGVIVAQAGVWLWEYLARIKA